MATDPWFVTSQSGSSSWNAGGPRSSHVTIQHSRRWYMGIDLLLLLFSTITPRLSTIICIYQRRAAIHLYQIATRVLWKPVNLQPIFCTGPSKSANYLLLLLISSLVVLKTLTQNGQKRKQRKVAVLPKDGGIPGASSGRDHAHRFSRPLICDFVLRV